GGMLAVPWLLLREPAADEPFRRRRLGVRGAKSQFVASNGSFLQRYVLSTVVRWTIYSQLLARRATVTAIAKKKTSALTVAPDPPPLHITPSPERRAMQGGCPVGTFPLHILQAERPMNREF